MEELISIWWVFTILGLCCIIFGNAANSRETARIWSFIGMVLCLIGLGLTVVGLWL